MVDVAEVTLIARWKLTVRCTVGVVALVTEMVLNKVASRDRVGIMVETTLTTTPLAFRVARLAVVTEVAVIERW